MRLLGSILCACALACAAAAGQASARVEGTVSDESGAVVVGARVVVRGAGEVTVRTDGAGRYEAARLAPGEYQISVSAEGFEPSAATVAVVGATLTRDFVLAPARLRAAVTVTAAKGNARPAADTPQPVTVADARSFETRRPASPLQAIEATPNLIQVGANPAGERPRLRGLTSNRLLVVIDGERLNNVRSDPLSGVSPSVLDVSQLQAVEVVAGAGSSLYGSDALAGTINLVTREPARADGRRLGLRFDGDARPNGSARRGALALNLSAGRFALRLAGSLFRAGNYQAGGSAVGLSEVVSAGRFLNELGNAAGNNVARTYAVWELPAGAEVPNGQARGFNFQGDLWAALSTRQSLRLRQLNSQHKSLGFPFIAPPFDPRRQSNTFRRLDKYGLRYEGRELSRRLPRLALGLYRQKYAFTDANLVSSVEEGSSWRLVPAPETEAGALPELTGRPSAFAPGIFTDGKNSVTSYGLDAQATLEAPGGLLLTTGLGYLRDSSRDEFSRFDFTPGAAGPRAISGRASNPDSVYRNLGWFTLLEYEPRPWLRLTGGFRLDDWRTRARPTAGFPLDKERAALSASFPLLAESPGSINVEGVRGVVGLVDGTGASETARTIWTGNVGVVLRAPGGLRPFFRWGTSYREPGVTERFALRDFGDPTFSVLLVANTELRPERGRSYDAGLKVQRPRWQASLGYFRQDFSDFLRPAFGEVLFVPAEPGRGLLPVSPFFPFHGVLYVQRTNTSRARTSGFEAAFEADVRLGRFGRLAPTASAGWLRGSDLTPDPAAVALVEQFYNRADTPVPLRASPNEVPLAGVVPFRGLFAVRYGAAGHGWFGEYEARHQSRVERADPLELSSTITTQFGTLASLSPLTKQTVRAGYDWRGESSRVLWTIGVENLTDRFYFEQFQTAPAPGRSLVFGLTVELFNLRR